MLRNLSEMKRATKTVPNRIVVLFVLILINIQVWGQGFYIEGATVAITSGAQLTLPDSLVNKGTLTNNGDITMSGVWLNQGIYNSGTGSINFKSDLAQTINHSNQAFQSLTISGLGEKLFLADITIESEINLQAGILRSSNDAVLILKPGVKVTGGSNESHIVGAVEQQGSGDWFFPIGNGASYLPVSILNVGDQQADAVLMLHDLVSGETLTSDPPIRELSIRRYWELNVLNGSLNNTQIVLPLENESFTESIEKLAVAEAKINLGPYVSLGQSGFQGNLISGSIMSEYAPSDRFFTIISVADVENIVVYNGVSPNDDGLNDYFRILNIEQFPANQVRIFNRWGDKVFDAKAYDNDQKAFKGISNLGSSEHLPSGIYYYRIDLGNDQKEYSGYLELKN